MARKIKADRVLFTAVLLLVCASVVMVYSASAKVAEHLFESPSVFLIKQAMWAALGLAMLTVAMRVDYTIYKHERLVWALLAIVGLMLVAVLLRAPINGSRRWFNILGLGIQPSELAKMGIVFFTAMTLERRLHRIDEMSYWLPPIAIVTGVTMGLLLVQPDLGTALIIALIVGTMAFAAGLSYRYIVGAALAAMPVIYILLMGKAYRIRRLEAWLDPWSDPLGKGFQIIQSFIAVGTGGVTGRGLMGGVQKLFYLPEPHTDFIFAVIGEELGLIGASAVLICFCVIAWRGLRIATRAEDPFGALTALGLTTMIAAQAFVNISVVLGLLPTKGIALPLVSFGGSSLLISLVAMGILLNISQHESADA